MNQICVRVGKYVTSQIIRRARVVPVLVNSVNAPCAGGTTGIVLQKPVQMLIVNL